jgi:hypothetical protein
MNKKGNPSRRDSEVRTVCKDDDEHAARDLNHVGDDEEKNKLRCYMVPTTCL